MIQDVGRRHPIDKRFVFTLAWNSSVPAAFAIAMRRVNGGNRFVYFAACTSYRVAWIACRGERTPFLLTHALHDKQGRFTWSEQAMQQLIDAGAIVKSTAP